MKITVSCNDPKLKFTNLSKKHACREQADMSTPARKRYVGLY